MNEPFSSYNHRSGFAAAETADWTKLQKQNSSRCVQLCESRRSNFRQDPATYNTTTPVPSSLHVRDTSCWCDVTVGSAKCTNVATKPCGWASSYLPTTHQCQRCGWARFISQMRTAQGDPYPGLRLVILILRLVIRWGGGGQTGPPGFWLTHPPTHIRKFFLRKKMKFIKGARTWRSILGTQTFFWPLTPPPPV